MRISPFRVKSDNLEPFELRPRRVHLSVDSDTIERIALAFSRGFRHTEGMPAPVLQRESPPAVAPVAVAVTMDEAVARWKERLTTRCRPRSVPKMIGVVRRVSDAAGWSVVSDVTMASAEAVLNARRRGDEGSQWAPATHDHAVTMLRIFGEFLRRSKLRDENPLADLEPIGVRDSQGARPLTPQQVCAMLIVAARAKSGHGKAWMTDAVLLATKVYTGLRLSEVQEARWGWLVEDSAGGTLLTDPECKGNKSGKRDELPMRSDLWELLRWWKTRVPHRADDLLFPRPLGHRRWHLIREGAGIPEHDPRRGAATPHSLRKSFLTWLDGLAIPRGLVSHLARHSGTLAEKVYIKHDPEKAREAVEQLPPLWAGDAKVFWTESHRKLDNGEKLADICAATLGSSSMSNALRNLGKTDRPVGMAASNVAVDHHGPGRSVQSSGAQKQEMRCFLASERADQVADVLDAISRLLRGS